MDHSKRGFVAREISNQVMKVYTDNNQYQSTNRYYLHDIIKASWNDRTQEERDRVYGAWTRAYEYTPDITRADIALLTFKWNYYVDRGLIPQAMAEIEYAAQHNKKTIVFSGGDSPANLVHSQVLLFESGGYRSATGLAYHSGQPFFLGDYLQMYCGGQPQPRAWQPIPVIGFCGQAGAAPLRSLLREVRLKSRQWQYKTGKLKWQPPPFETSAFRRFVLRQFESDARVRTNFLLREKYHAGNDRDKDAHSPQKLAFINNIFDSDYTVCVRGGGNFSIRFYETLALGRIPVFIDTDCLLPFHDRIPYHEYFPWIEVKDLPRAAEIVSDFHTRLGADGFLERQQTCRKLWEEHFTADGFYGDLHRLINAIV